LNCSNSSFSPRSAEGTPSPPCQSDTISCVALFFSEAWGRCCSPPICSLPLLSILVRFLMRVSFPFTWPAVSSLSPFSLALVIPPLLFHWYEGYGIIDPSRFRIGSPSLRPMGDGSPMSRRRMNPPPSSPLRGYLPLSFPQPRSIPPSKREAPSSPFPVKLFRFGFSDLVRAVTFAVPCPVFLGRPRALDFFFKSAGRDVSSLPRLPIFPILLCLFPFTLLSP